MVSTRRGRWLTILVLLAVCLVSLVWYFNRSDSEAANTALATPTNIDESSESIQQQLTMSEVLDLAIEVRKNMSVSLDDYQARFVKQEVDKNGTLSGVTEMRMKVQTRVRGDREDAPMRVYLRFEAPDAVKGREVIWGEDLYDGKMAVHEVGLLLSLKTLWLDPEGMLAMQGQRYPIGEIGLVKLTEKLIERGEKDRNNPDITVTVGVDPEEQDSSYQLIQIRRGQSSGLEDDFSLAEVVFDPERQLILGYRSFGWAEDSSADPPLLESYRYFDVETNVGLTDQDFATTNTEYSFPTY